jgi:hypothetical protein
MGKNFKSICEKMWDKIIFDVHQGGMRSSSYNLHAIGTTRIVGTSPVQWESKITEQLH